MKSIAATARLVMVMENSNVADWAVMLARRQKDGTPLSLESFFEETELEFEDPGANQCKGILTVMLFEDLLEKLHQQAPDLASIFEMLNDGKSQYTIAELISKPQTTMNYLIKRMRMILQQHVGREDLGI